MGGLVSADNDRLWTNLLSSGRLPHREDPVSPVPAPTEGRDRADWQMSDAERQQHPRERADGGASYGSRGNGYDTHDAKHWAAVYEAQDKGRAINDAQRAVDADLWEFTDFDAVEDLPPKPTIGEFADSRCLWRPGTVNGMHGVRGMAKTWVLYSLMVREMKKGNHVAAFDFEMGGGRVRKRMRLLGASDDELRTLLHHTKPKGPMSAASLDHLAKRIDRIGGVLTIAGFDTVSKSMQLRGVDSNNADEVTGWFEAEPVPVITAFPTAAAVLLDHLPKGSEDSLFPIGSEAKAANVDTQYLVRSFKKFSKEKDGYSDLICAKGRDGDYNEGEAVVRFHGGPSGFYFVPSGTGRLDGDLNGDNVSIDLSSIPDEDEIWTELNGYMPDGILQTEFCGRGAAGGHRKKLLRTLESKGRARCAPGGRAGRGYLWFTV